MKIANLAGRLSVVVESGVIDVGRASGGRFPEDPQQVFEILPELRAWIADNAEATQRLDATSALLAPVPRPRQVFGIGLNYRDHANETGLETSPFPIVFTKFPTCLAGPDARVALPTEMVDWEVELVVVVGVGGNDIGETAAWAHVAGLTIGQDLSERGIMLQDTSLPQISLGKSYQGFGPIGPWFVTADEFNDPDDLAISCSVNGEVVQSARTSQMIFSVAEIVARLSSIVMLLPGDLIFTGTPAGVGVAREPRRFLATGDVLESAIEDIGSLRTFLTGGTNLAEC